MQLAPGVETVADRLGERGYRTLMSGKWHLGDEFTTLPNAHGFDQSFALAASGADNWEQRTYMPYYADAPWFENGQPASLPEDFYSSRFIVDKMIDYIGNSPQEQTPFFALVAFQAIHIPVQAPAEFVARYKGVYDRGWDALRLERWRKAQTLGLIPEGAPLGNMHPSLRRWETLSANEQRTASTRMEVNAAMLDAMDHHIGRLLQHLQSEGVLDQTIIILTSDNGPEGSDPTDQLSFRAWAALTGYDLDDQDTPGERSSYGFIGPEWASAAASPFSLFKFYTTEGGIRVPLVISGPGIPENARFEQRTMLTDITPTILELTGTGALRPPADAITGHSLVPLLRGQVDSVYRTDEPIIMEITGNIAVLKGDYKLIRTLRPLGDGSWRLFDLAQDPGETRNLYTELPAVAAELSADYDHYALTQGVLPVGDDFNPWQQIYINSTLAIVSRNALAFTAVALVILLLLYGFIRNRSRRRSTGSPAAGSPAAGSPAAGSPAAGSPAANNTRSDP
nr:sulfatase-like hydrolase/transferase [Kineobactrum sediminis]